MTRLTFMSMKCIRIWGSFYFSGVFCLLKLTFFHLSWRSQLHGHRSKPSRDRYDTKVQANALIKVAATKMWREADWDRRWLWANSFWNATHQFRICKTRDKSFKVCQTQPKLEGASLPKRKFLLTYKRTFPRKTWTHWHQQSQELAPTIVRDDQDLHPHVSIYR